ncbi:hypothetical protein ACET3Z_025281 [Daucus carota]
MARTKQTKRKKKRGTKYLEQSPHNAYAKKPRTTQWNLPDWNPGRDEIPDKFHRSVDGRVGTSKSVDRRDETPDQFNKSTDRRVETPKSVDKRDEKTPDESYKSVNRRDETPILADRRDDNPNQAHRLADRRDETTHASYRSHCLNVRPCSPCLHVGHTPYSQRLADSEKWDEIITFADKWDETVTLEYEIPDLDKWDAMLPFLKVVCQSKKSWEARDSGIKFVKQIAIHMGHAVLPHLRPLVEIIEQGLYDENSWIRTSTALSLAALAQASAPYGIMSFESVFDPLVNGIRSEWGETFASFLKAIFFLIPLMDALHARHYAKIIMDILICESESHYEETGEILEVVNQCVRVEGVEADYIRENILPEFFRRFLCEYTDFGDRKQLVEITFEITKKVGVADIVEKIVEALKNKREPCRMVAMKAIEKIVANLGATNINGHLEELLVDGILYAFKEQTSSDIFNMTLNGFVVVLNSLEWRVRPYLPQICDTIKVCLDNKSCKVRQKAAYAISQIAGVLKQCEEEQLMANLGVVLHEKLAEECPEVLGSVMEALKAIKHHQ